MKEVERYLEEIEGYFEKNISFNIENPLALKVENINESIEEIALKVEKIKVTEEEFRKTLINEYKLKERIRKEREKKVVLSLISILDNVEYFFKEEKDLNKRRVSLIKKLIKRELGNANIRSISKVGELYNEEYHMCIGYLEKMDKEDKEILEVIREGYIYRGHLVRQAEVIINNRGREE
ncbi:nucleotide exchange factor GrpE [Cetobacterium sp.]|uniref:nucleotide exchange factor GrpE n=1 Tax=Cetobacterium sp. TaxID=2071632 RepID=UPI003F40BCDF